MTKQNNKDIKIFALQVNFIDKQTQRQIKIKMVIVDGATTCFYSDIGFAKKAYQDAKRKGLKVVFIPRKNAVVEAYEGKSMEQIRDYELALLKESGRKFKEMQG